MIAQPHLLRRVPRRPTILSRSASQAPTPPPLPAASFSSIILRDFQSIGVSRRCDPHSILIREGFLADHLLLVLNGRVKVTASSTEGRLLLLRVAGPGDFLGLAALLQNGLYGVTAEALEPCLLKSIPRADFLAFMATYPDIGHIIVQALAHEYNGAVLTARRLALSSSAAGKLASTLLDLSRADKPYQTVAHTNLPISFLMPLTHEDLGSMAGLTRETVSRLLTRFRREGQVHQLHDRMTLHNPHQLEARYR